MTTSAAKGLVTKSYNKLLSVKTGPFKVVEVSPTTVPIDEDGIYNTVSVDRSTVALTARDS